MSKEWDDIMIEEVKKANKSQCVVEGLTYPQIKKLEKALLKATIDCNVSVGCLKIYANYQDARVIKICKRHKAIPQMGVSTAVSNSIFENQSKKRNKL